MPPSSVPSRLTRRRLIGGATALAVAPPLVVAQEPGPLRFMLGSSLIPGVDEFIRQLVQRWADLNGGIPFDIEFVPQAILPLRVARAIDAGEQRDIVEFQDLQPFRHTAGLIDVTDVAAETEALSGAYAPWATSTVRVQGVWFSLPIGAQLAGVTYRPSKLAAAGMTAADLATWEGVLAAAQAIATSTGTPTALAFAQTPIASTALAYSWMWAHGAAELEPGSRHVTFDSDVLRQSLGSLQTALASGAFDARSLHFDDVSIHNAFIAGEVAMAICGASPYLTQRALGDSDIAVASMPAGPAGTFVPLGSRSLGISTRGGRPEEAKNFLRWLLEPAQYTSLVIAHQGALVPPGSGLQDLPVFSQDVNIVAIAAGSLAGRHRGWSAAPSLASAVVAGNQFVVNTFADVARGEDIATATARGQDLMNRFYTRQRD